MNVGLSWVLRRPIETTRLLSKFATRAAEPESK
jgi:hypothetical protein